jgi:hypothetical protein
MSIRFRIRTPGGQELSFASVKMFEDFVRSGDLSDNDLVYDAQDGSWAPARTHPIVLEIQYELENPPAEVEADGAPGGANEEEPGPDNAFGLSLAPAPQGSEGVEPSGGPAADDEESPGAENTHTDSDADASGLGFGLDLALPDAPSAEEERQRFLERMAAERADERDLTFGDDGVSGFQMETTGSMADLVAPEPAPPPPPPRAPVSTDPFRPREPVSTGPSRPAAPRDERDRRPEPRPPAPSKGGGAGRLLVGVLLVGVLGVGGFLGLRMAQGDDEAEPEPSETPVEAIPVESEPEPEPTPEPVIARTEGAVRERAQERFLTATQNAFRDLPSVPDAWPGGAYLALPSAYPEVLDTWQAYLVTARRVRADDGARYAAAYEAALDDAVIEGDERNTRLEAALVEFEASAAARAAHFDRVEALASAAIQSHNALVEAEGLLIYDGSGDDVAAGPIGAGVSARDEDSAVLLEQVVELLTATLEAEGLGPRSGENVRAWVWDGFLNTVTN